MNSGANICNGEPMTNKPTTAAGYAGDYTDLVRATCLYVATKLGDLMDDLVIVGGLVPTLLIQQEPSSKEASHAGTRDLDIGLGLAMLDGGRYQTLTERLRQAQFVPDFNDQNNPTRQRWRTDGPHGVPVDFLIQPSRPDDEGGRLRNIEPDFAAIITPGLHLAFQDREAATISGKTIAGEKATRSIWVCGPSAYVVLKALAFRDRGENKDAYDLYYVVRNYGSHPADVTSRLKHLLEDCQAKKALRILQEDFLNRDSLGPRRVAAFIKGTPDDDIQADVVGFIKQLLEGCA